LNICSIQSCLTFLIRKKKIIKFLIFLVLYAFPFLVLSQDFEWGNPTDIRSINSTEDDFAPQWNKFENRLYFSSLRKGKSKFFVSQLDENGNFTSPIELKDPLNRATGNVSYISFLSETEAVLNAYRQGLRQAYLNIFHSLRRGGNWLKPILLDSLQCECFVLHPTISPDGTFIIFSSNKDGSKKDLDLFIAYRMETGVWGNIEKLEELNTDGDEITPFLASSDTLYFASNGYGGPGGFDIYFSIRKGTNWEKPNPLNLLNTRFNESDFVIVNDTLALFVSDRPEGIGKLDIYSAVKTQIPDTTTKPQKRIELSLSVQVPTVRLESSYLYDFVQFPEKIPSVRKLKEFDPNFKEEKISKYEDIIDNAVSIIFARWKSSRSEITFAFDTNNIELKTLIVNAISLLSKEYPESQSKIQISHSNDKNLTVFASDSNIYKPLKLVKKQTNFEPPVLEVFINYRKEEQIKKWELKIRNSSFKITGETLSPFIRIDLSKALESDFNLTDTLFIDLIVYDSSLNSYSITYPIVLSLSKTVLRNSYVYKGKIYERLFLSSNFDKSSASLISLINEIAEYREYINGAVVVMDKTTAQSNLSELIDFVSQRLQIKKENTKIEYDPKDYEASFGKLPENTIIFLLERK
jgi:hypothetical protein